MSKLTRRAIEKAMGEAVEHMPIVLSDIGAKRDFRVEVRGMAIDVFIDALTEQGVEVDESMTEQEKLELAGASL